ncbi:jacalin-like lectin [Alicyclobacillus fastidiosus]|uniref:jacalin-like lectin n=1 Tax=Alicyclobacillus fastidiosus TaxID=392011 RepID=UPI0023E93FFA|nr:hypothetical protein GCM10025859_01560 [Alicyclobacillus fastidiosus]GMA65565.1 hypothetical protein GCM10025859_60050 [Alicyclobacillus fastidiosus]
MAWGRGGKASQPFNLQPRERLTTISGTAGKYVNQLQFKTNYEQPFVWPPSPDGAKVFPVLSLNKNQVILGFQGRSGGYLDQLQPVICTFSPAVWLESQQ